MSLDHEALDYKRYLDWVESKDFLKAFGIDPEQEDEKFVPEEYEPCKWGSIHLISSKLTEPLFTVRGELKRRGKTYLDLEYDIVDNSSVEIYFVFPAEQDENI